MRRTIGSLALGTLVMGSLIVIAEPAHARSGSAFPAAVFTCSGQLGEYYTLQSVTGTVRGTTPRGVTALNYQSLPLTKAKVPALDNGWDGGYWKQTYQMNQWAIGSRNGTTYHFMVPDTRIGATFTAMLFSDFGMGGNWQNWMDCTAA
jgi:hypothetical protein